MPNKLIRKIGLSTSIGVAALALAACKQIPQLQIASSKAFPAPVSTDQCSAEVQALRDDHAYFQQPLVSRAMAKQFAGFLQNMPGVLDGLFSGNSSGLKSAVQGSTRGFFEDVAQAAVSGATKDYLGQVGEQNNGDYSGVSRRINTDAGGESQRLAQVRKEIRQLQSCRNRQVANIDSRYKRKRITSQEALVEYRQLQTLVQRDNQLVEKILAGSGDRIKVYGEADRYVVKRSVTPKAQSSGVTTRPKPVKSAPNVAKAEKTQKEAKKDQQKIAQLDQIIEDKKGGLA